MADKELELPKIQRVKPQPQPEPEKPAEPSPPKKPKIEPPLPSPKLQGPHNAPPSPKGGTRRRLVKLRKSHRSDKKWDAVFETPQGQKVVSFGQKGYSDFTKHKDVTRRARYVHRHSGMGEHWDNPMTPGALSRWILWNKTTLRASVADYKKRFHL